MRTVGRKRPSQSPRGDFQALCDQCGVMWYRHRLRRDASGFLTCPDDNDVGHDVVTLSRANAADASQSRGPLAFRDGGNYDQTDIEEEAVHYTTAEEAGL